MATVAGALGNITLFVLALGALILTLYGESRFRQQDRQWEQDPANAAVEPTTEQKLKEQEQECTGSRF